MGLQDFIDPSETIQFPGGEFAVRGLSLSDISYIVRGHATELGILFTTISEKVQGGDDLDKATSDIISLALETAPRLVADIVAVGAGEPTMGDKVVRLPFGTQIEALEKIGTLTFATEGGVGKVVETVIRVLNNMGQIKAKF